MGHPWAPPAGTNVDRLCATEPMGQLSSWQPEISKPQQPRDSALDVISDASHGEKLDGSAVRAVGSTLHHPRVSATRQDEEGVSRLWGPNLFPTRRVELSAGR